MSIPKSSLFVYTVYSNLWTLRQWKSNKVTILCSNPNCWISNVPKSTNITDDAKTGHKNFSHTGRWFEINNVKYKYDEETSKKMHTAAFRFRFFATIVPYISNISSMFGEFALQKCIWCPKGIREPIYMPVCVLVRFLYLCTTSDVIHAIHLIEFEQLYSFFLICCLFLVKRLLDQR